jgi:PmbA protein
MDFVEFKKIVIAQCEALGIEEYELYYESEESTTVGVFQQEINQFTGSVEGGVCFRCISGGKMGYASTEELSAEQAQSIVSRALENAAYLESDEAVFLGEGGQTYLPVEPAIYPKPETSRLIDTALTAQKTLYSLSNTVADGSTTRAFTMRGALAIYNSRGLDLSYVNQLSGITISAMIQTDGERVSDAQIRLGDLEKIDYREQSQKAIVEATAKLGGKTPDTGIYPVVFSPKAMASLLETFSPVFSAERTQKGLSALAGKEGERIGAECLTIVDDPMHPENLFRRNFDSEGSPAYSKNVIENGILTTLLHNLKTANTAGMKTTGNAAKAGYAGTVSVQPYTMYIAPGTATEKELLERAGNGVYIDFLTGLHAGANAVTGDFSLQSGGYRIENGCLTERISAFTVAGNFYDLLKKILYVAENMILPSPVGKTTFGAPSVLVEGLSIAGK